MIQDIVYAIKYDKLEALKLNNIQVSNLENEMLQGALDWRHHPIITCIYQDKNEYIDSFIKLGFNFNSQFKTHSLLFCSLFESKKNLFTPLYDLGACFKEEEKQKALKRACENKLPIEVIHCLIKEKCFTTIKPMIQMANIINSPNLIDLAMQIDPESVKSQAAHALKLSLDYAHYALAEKYLNLFHQEIDLTQLDTTFFSPQTEEFLNSFILKTQLEKNITHSSLIKKVKI